MELRILQGKKTEFGKWMFYTGCLSCLFKYGNSHRISRRMLAFCAIKLPRSGTRQNGHCIQGAKRNSAVGNVLWRAFYRTFFVMSSFWQGSSCSASRKIPLLMWNPNIWQFLAYGMDIACCGCETLLCTDKYTNQCYRLINILLE